MFSKTVISNENARSKKYTIIGLLAYMIVIMSLQLFVVTATGAFKEDGQATFNYAWFIGMAVLATIFFVMIYGRVYDLIAGTNKKDKEDKEEK